jgi:rubredoxin
MPEWKCNNCGYQFTADRPPEDACPNCHEKCEYLDVTCYIPECGGPGAGTSDQRLGDKPYTKK